MSRIFGVLLVLVIAVVGFGLYRGWFHFSTEEEGQKSNIKLEIDKDKIREDEKKAMEKLEEAGQSIKEKTKSATEKAKDESSKP